MHHHHFHKIHIVDGVTLLNGVALKADDSIEVAFPDGHHAHGQVVSQCCGSQVPQLFLPVEFHGRHPWVLLKDGTKARFR